MKKILLIIASIAVSMQLAGAQEQVKTLDAAKVAVEKAQKNVDAKIANPKKNPSAKDWQNLGKALMDSDNSVLGNGWVGCAATEFQLVMGKEKPISEEQVELMGESMTKQVYPTHNYYISSTGILSIIEITNPVYPDALDRALEAYKQMYTLDPKKASDVALAIKTIATKYSDEAYAAYSLGDPAKASRLFEKVVRVSQVEPYTSLDTNALYNAGFTAWIAQDMGRAKPFFKKCIDLGYYGENGEAFAKLSDICEKLGDKQGQKTYLESGFTKFPESQSILIGLINFYMTSGENTEQIFDLLDAAKKNEPTNASLYYVEGNIRSKLGDMEKAVAAYESCIRVDPSYEFGFIGEGIMFYEKAVELSEKAQNELDDAKYMALVAEFEKALKDCIEPFEKAFKITKDESIKLSIAEYLKNANFRFRDQDSAFEQAYNNYDSYIKANKEKE